MNHSFLTTVYNGAKTQSVIEKFKPILKKSLNDYINELMSDKISTALNTKVNIPAQSNDTVVEVINDSDISDKKARNIVTTEEELEAYFIVKSISQSQ